MAHDDLKSTFASQAPPPPADTSDRARLLHALGAAEDDPLTMVDLYERGIRMPGQAIYELELDGYPVERVHRRGRGQCGRVLGYRLGSSAGGARDHANMRSDA